MIMEADSRYLVYVNAESISTAGRLGSEQTVRFCQAVPRGDIRPTCVSARCGWLPPAAISTSREWAAIGEVAPLLLAAGVAIYGYASDQRSGPAGAVSSPRRRRLGAGAAGYRASGPDRVLQPIHQATHSAGDQHFVDPGRFRMTTAELTATGGGGYWA